MRIFLCLASREANGVRRYRANVDSVIRERERMEWYDFTNMCGETKGRRNAATKDDYHSNFVRGIFTYSSN